MVIIPNILILCSLMTIKGYFETTMGAAFHDRVDPGILKFFICKITQQAKCAGNADQDQNDKPHRSLGKPDI